jgi:hypothetical protein
MTKRTEARDRSVEIRIGGQSKAVGGLSTFQDIIYQIVIPHSFSGKEVGIAQRDFEILAEMMKDHPDKVQDMIQSVLSGNAARARTTGSELGLDEAKFIAKGGGLPVAVIVIAVACALLLASDNPQ